MALPELERNGDGRFPIRKRTERARISPVQECPEFFVFVLDSRTCQTNAAESVDIVHGLGGF